MLGGLLSTLKISPRLAVKEALRRTLRVSYTYDGFTVSNKSEFKALRAALSRGYKLYRGEGSYLLQTGFGKFHAPELNMLSTLLLEDFEELYGPVRGEVVLDVGAYIGDTAVWFYNRGAREVVAYEPVFHRLCNENLALNGYPPSCVAKGVWGYDGVLGVKVRGPSTGDELGEHAVEVVGLGSVLSRSYDAAKFDCEGCEWWLLTLPCEALRRVGVYAVEIHGAPAPLVDKFETCGYKIVLHRRIAPYVNIFVFTALT